QSWDHPLAKGPELYARKDAYLIARLANRELDEQRGRSWGLSFKLPQGLDEPPDGILILRVQRFEKLLHLLRAHAHDGQCRREPQIGVESHDFDQGPHRPFRRKSGELLEAWLRVAASAEWSL